MKVQWYKKLICYAVIVILFISGMHVKIDTPHSYFVYQSKINTTEQQYKNQKTFISVDYCTNKLLQPQNTQYIRNNSTRNLVIRKTQNLLLSNFSFAKQLKTFYLTEYYLTNALSARSSVITIIEYIHRQDGAK